MVGEAFDGRKHVFELTAEALIAMCSIQCGISLDHDILIYRKILCSKYCSDYESDYILFGKCIIVSMAIKLYDKEKQLGKCTNLWSKYIVQVCTVGTPDILSMLL